MPLGVHPYCKQCKSICAKEEYLKHKDKYIERAKDYRTMKPEACKAANTAYRKTARGKIAMQTNLKNMRAKYPEKARARDITYRALRSGHIKKARVCFYCNTCTDKLEIHHHDYDNPWDFSWLCIPCHKLLHKESIETWIKKN